MTSYSTEALPLLAVIQQASALARELILVLKREAEALSGNSGVMPASLAETKERFLHALASVLDQLRDNPSGLGLEESRAFNELQALIAEMRTAPLDSLIAAHPETVQYRYERAGTFLGQGRNEDACRDYQAVLSQEPNHFGALNDLAILLSDAGQYGAARGLFYQAVNAHPEIPAGHLNLADLLLSQAEYEAAKSHYQAALELDPGLKEAHQGLSLALAGLGDETGASVHRESGFRGQAVITWPYRGAGKALPLVVLSSAFGGNIPIKHVLDKRIFQSTVILTEYFEPATPLPPHRLIINLIGDADLCKPGLDAAETILSGSSAPVINHPALVRPTGRLENARRLGALPGIKTPRMALLPKSELMASTAAALLASHEIDFPLLLRSPGYHTGQHFVRVESFGELSRAADELPGQDLLAMQMLDARNRHGDSHKFRVIFVDGALYPLHLAISRHWKVHYFSADMDVQPEHRAQEAAFLQDMKLVLGHKAMAALDNIRRILGLDYGGIDFALAPDGGILLFEANATMVVQRPEDCEKWAYRRAATERILDAVRNMVIKRASESPNAL